MSVFKKLRGTSSGNFSIGVGTAGHKYLEADTGNPVTLPYIRYNDTLKRWEISNDGTTIYSPDLDWLLDCEPTRPDTTHTITRVLGNVTNETWKRTADLTNLKTIDYTYAAGKVSTEDRKLYAADGLTVVARLLVTYIYGMGLVIGSTRQRLV